MAPLQQDYVIAGISSGITIAIMLLLAKLGDFRSVPLSVCGFLIAVVCAPFVLFILGYQEAAFLHLIFFIIAISIVGYARSREARRSKEP